MYKVHEMFSMLLSTSNVKHMTFSFLMHFVKHFFGGIHLYCIQLDKLVIPTFGKCLEVLPGPRDIFLHLLTDFNNFDKLKLFVKSFNFILFY